MFSASLKSGSASAPKDPQFNYVTMLLHGDGTNGAQNNTFLDSSTNNFTITRNGNTTQGSFSPYGSNWSNFFNASTALYNTTAPLLSSTASTFTAEAWVFLTATPTNASYPSMGSVITLNGQKTSTAIYMSFGITTSNTVSLYWYDGAGKACTSSGTVTLNQWTHIAASVNANAITLYINGTSQTLAGTTTLTNRAGSVNEFTVGGNYYSTTPAYISNARVTNTAVYSSSFTPSTTPLTAISGTQLLTCQSNRFVDNSTNVYAFTVSGTPSVQRFNPFGAYSAYSTSVIGGSGYFDGNGDFLSAPANAVFSFGTGDFTIEGWVYPTGTNTGAPMVIVEIRTNATNTTGFSFVRDANALTLNVYQNGYKGASSNSLALNAWNHVALVRSGNTWAYWINGVASGSFSNSTNLTDGATTGPKIGGSTTAGEVWIGYMTDVRLVKGTAVYTTTFTPPTAPLTAITNTSLLLNYTNGAIFDNAMMNDLETVGNAQISTSVKKYGTGSMSFVRSPSSYLVANNTTGLLSLGTGDWTVEAWVYMNTLPSGNGYSDSYWIVGGGPVSSDAGFDIAIGNTNLQVGLTSFASLNINTAHGMSQTTWYHVAVARSGVTLYAFINGVQLTSASVSGVTVDPCLTGLAISAAEPTGATLGNFNGYIDDLRITKGYARYTAAFTPPTAAFPNIGPT